VNGVSIVGRRSHYPVALRAFAANQTLYPALVAYEGN